MSLGSVVGIRFGRQKIFGGNIQGWFRVYAILTVMLGLIVGFQNCSPYQGASGSKVDLHSLLTEDEAADPVGGEPQRVSQLTSLGKGPISWPHTFTWSTEGMEPGSRVDLWINGVDQGDSVPSLKGLWTVESGPLGEVKVELLEILQEGSIKSHDSVVVFVRGESESKMPIGNIVQEVNIPRVSSSSIDQSLWNQMTNDAHIFLTGSPSQLQIVDDESDWWIRADHLAGKVADLTQATALPTSKTTTVYHTIKFAPNWNHGQGSLDSGKLGWGLAGGSTATNVIVSGGSTETTGWSMRWMFDGDYLGIYAYYSNRVGMNYPNRPPDKLAGEFILTDVRIEPGRSYELEMTVTTNDPGVANGSLIVVVDGLEKIRKSGMYYMSGVPETDRLFFASNHGGNAGDSGWAPLSSTWVQYKDVSVYHSSPQ